MHLFVSFYNYIFALVFVQFSAGGPVWVSFLPSSGCFRFTGLTAISLPESLPFRGKNSVGHRFAMLGHSKVKIEIGVY